MPGARGGGRGERAAASRRRELRALAGRGDGRRAGSRAARLPLSPVPPRLTLLRRLPSSLLGLRRAGSGRALWRPTSGASSCQFQRPPGSQPCFGVPPPGEGRDDCTFTRTATLFQACAPPPAPCGHYSPLLFFLLPYLGPIFYLPVLPPYSFTSLSRLSWSRSVGPLLTPKERDGVGAGKGGDWKPVAFPPS